eukprot:15365141-Ditylum_brightwellii.AAC.2
MAFWRELLNSVREMEYKRNGTNPYLYFKWRVAAQTVPAEATEFTDRFDCNESGPRKTTDASSPNQYYCRDMMTNTCSVTEIPRCQQKPAPHWYMPTKMKWWRASSTPTIEAD